MHRCRGDQSLTSPVIRQRFCGLQSISCHHFSLRFQFRWKSHASSSDSEAYPHVLRYNITTPRTHQYIHSTPKAKHHCPSGINFYCWPMDNAAHSLSSIAAEQRQTQCRFVRGVMLFTVLDKPALYTPFTDILGAQHLCRYKQQ